MSTTYQPAGTSAFDRMNVPTECGCCGRQGLKVTVKMSGPQGIVWMGTGCAAKATGQTVVEFKADVKAADDAATTADRAARQAASDAEFATWKAFLDAAAGPGDTGEQIRRLGGYAAARAAQRAQ